jgi:glycosyltransferase involved in cell wall biosynthesis
MRILHAIAFLGVGGAERMVLQLSADAARRGDAVAIASSGGPWRVMAKATGAEWHRVPLERRFGVVSPASVSGLRAVVTRFRPDLIHTHNVGVTLATRAAVIGVRPAPRLLTTFHGVAPGDYRRAARLLRFAAPRVIACSAAVARSLASAGYPAERVAVITNGASLEPATPERIAAVRREYDLAESRLVIGVGRLVVQKSWSTLIEASRHLERVSIVVAGPGDLLEELQAAAAEAGTGVRFIGPVSDVAALLGCAACWVSTSSWEGLPLTLLEALSLGVPAITTAVDGVQDVVTEDAAVIVPVGDAYAVARAITRVLDDADLAERLSKAGRALATAWAPETMITRYREAYRTAVEHSQFST